MKKIFVYRPEVKDSDIDNLGHVNNEVYLRWLIEAAMAHSNFVGYTLEKFLEMQSSFVVRRHELDYLLPTFKNDRLRIETWTDPMDGSRALRNYEIYNEESNKLVLKGQTMWVFINLQTGRPTKIPNEIIEAFANFQPQK
jgi:acyl-CoA thioester hydrolase